MTLQISMIAVWFTCCNMKTDSHNQGDGNGPSAPCRHLEVPNRNLQNMRDKHVDQSRPETCDTLFVLNSPRWKKTVSKCIAMYMQDFSCSVTGFIVYLKCWFCRPDKGAFYCYPYIIYTEWPKKIYTLFTHQYKGAVRIHFFGPLCILFFSL
jgi:hypothetical protein